MQDSDRTMISSLKKVFRQKQPVGLEEDSEKTMIPGSAFRQNQPRRDENDIEKTVVAGSGFSFRQNQPYRQDDNVERTVVSVSCPAFQRNQPNRNDDNVEKTVVSAFGSAFQQNQPYTDDDNIVNTMVFSPRYASHRNQSFEADEDMDRAMVSVPESSIHPNSGNEFDAHSNLPEADSAADSSLNEEKPQAQDSIQADGPVSEKEPEDRMLQQPFLAWLLCIKGPEQWNDFRIAQNTTVIGCGETFGIILAEKVHPSMKSAAVITYNQENQSYLIKSAGENKTPPLLNGDPVQQITLMQPYDRIQLSEAELLFIPVCCEKYDWAEEKNAAEPTERKNGADSEAPAQIIRCKYGHYYDSKLYSRCPVCNPGDKRPIDRLALAEEIWKENHAREAEKN